MIAEINLPFFIFSSSFPPCDLPARSFSFLLLLPPFSARSPYLIILQRMLPIEAARDLFSYGIPDISIALQVRVQTYRSARITRCAAAKSLAPPPPLQPKRLGQISSFFNWEPRGRVLSGSSRGFSNFASGAEILGLNMLISGLQKYPKIR